MAFEKKYTARQVAEALLKTTHEVLAKSELAKKYVGFKAVEESARKGGAHDPAAVAAAVGRKKYGKEAFQEAASKGKKMGKAENPDKDADAELGEKVEHDVEEHMLANKDAEEKEGHKIMECPNCGHMHKSEQLKDLCNKFAEAYETLEKAEKIKKAGPTLGSIIGYPGAPPVAKAESKHDRCVEHVKENSPEVKNPHAVCVAEGVKPAKWKKSEMEKYMMESEKKGHALDKHGLSPEQIKAKLEKHGLSPAQIKAHLEKHGLSAGEMKEKMQKYETENHKWLGYKLSEAGRNEKQPNKSDKDYEVHEDQPKNALGPESEASHSHPEVQKSEEDRLREQTDPMHNPKEQAEGNNELAGTTPTQVGQDGKNIPGGDEIKGHLKLAKFLGRMEHKRSLKSKV